MRLIILSSQLLALLITFNECDARSTRVTAQYSVVDESDNSQRTFKGKGIVEDASVTDDGILTKFNVRPTRNPVRGQKKKASQSVPSANFDLVNYPQEQISFKPEIFAAKGKVYDDKTVPTRATLRSRPTQQSKSQQQQFKSTQLPTAKVQSVPISQFRFPSIKNEEIFETKLQESPSTLNTKNFKPEELESTYSYSTIKFNDDDNDDSKIFTKKVKAKPPKRSAASHSSAFNLEQSFGGPLQQSKFNTAIDHGEQSYENFNPEGFQPSTQFSSPTTTKRQKSSPPKKLFTSPEDEFKDSEFYDFSHRPKPSQSSPKFEKFASDLGVKSLGIKAHKNKFDPPYVQNGGFKPSGSFKLKDIPNIHGSEIGHGIASPGQIKTFYDAAESERDERYKLKLQNDPNPATKAQLAQFLRAKEDEQLEKLVEQQFKLQQQKQIAQEKEAELKHQRFLLQRQKEKLKQVEKNLNDKVIRQNPRPKRRPSPNSPAFSSSRRQRNPSPLNFSVHGTSSKHIPMRTLKSKDGSYRVSFNI
ncbi:hypothetical protein PVAND_000256 [Polypedilum vanderplanki]|uniref:Uncharacterized protein n=1 Tax=Polypedilum vanderplanki TaxID=319348 RepID=A0A9J6BK45_POLVA|nr:hypothetical protein PVAND_000256 [Polypedilum vanderplanki]